MFYFEDNELKNRMIDAEEKHFKYFEEDFPIFEVLSEIPTVDEIEKLEKIIVDCISDDKVYPKSNDYDDRFY